MILLSLRKLDFLTRDQLRKIHMLGEIRNTNRVLRGLSPYLSSFREEFTTVYYLNSLGREYVNSHKIRRKNCFVGHVLMRNDFYIFSGFPFEWRNEVKVSDDRFTIICDTWFKKNGKYHFLEVDYMQKMKENREKIKRYIGLFENRAVKNHLGYFPKLIWLTATEFRRKQLMELCKALPCEVYTIDDIR